MINVSDLLDGPAKDGWMSLGANVPVHLNQGIADTVVHPSRPRRVKTDDELEGYDHKSGRGKYRCGRCGQPKVYNLHFIYCTWCNFVKIIHDDTR
jgi:hypothetical protein